MSLLALHYLLRDAIGRLTCIKLTALTGVQEAEEAALELAGRQAASAADAAEQQQEDWSEQVISALQLCDMHSPVALWAVSKASLKLASLHQLPAHNKLCLWRMR